MQFTKAIRPDQLEQELRAAGVEVNGLGTAGSHLFTYDAGGVPIELPAEAQAIVEAHEPVESPTPPDPAAAIAALVEHLGLKGPLPEPVQQVLDAHAARSDTPPPVPTFVEPGESPHATIADLAAFTVVVESVPEPDVIPIFDPEPQPGGDDA